MCGVVIAIGCPSVCLSVSSNESTFLSPAFGYRRLILKVKRISLSGLLGQKVTAMMRSNVKIKRQNVKFS